MSGIRGRSGPINNLNNCKNPWRAFWKRRALKVGHRWVLPVLETYASGLLCDKPGASEAEKRAIEVAQISRGCAMLILSECAEKGLVRQLANGDWDLTSGSKELARFLNTELAALRLLGLERRSRDGGDIALLIQEATETTDER